MRGRDTQAGVYREAVTVQAWNGATKVFETIGSLRAAVLQKPMGPQGSQSNVDFVTRYRTDLTRANLLIWRGVKFFISNLLDPRMQKRELQITGINAVPITLTTTGSGPYTAKTVSSATAGTALLSFDTLSTGLTAVAANDTFTVSPFSAQFRITHAVTAASGELTAVPFTPVLSGPVAASAAVRVTKTAQTYAVQGAVEAYSGQELDGTLIQVTDVRVFLLLSMLAAAGYAGTPMVGDKITVSGKARTVMAVNTVYNDGAAIAVDLQAR